MSAKIKLLDIDEHSLDNSGDGELLGMVDDGSFGSGEEKLTPFLDNSQEEGGQYFKDINGRVTYRFVPMSNGDESSVNTISTDSPTPGSHYFVIDPVQVFGPQSTTKKVIRRDPLPSKAVMAKKRDDKRRVTHNEVERRRRDKINSWIMKLGALVPHAGLPDSASKGGILAKACDYITQLNDRAKRLDQVERENEKLEIEVLKLNEELTDIMRENTSLREQLDALHLQNNAGKS